VGIAPKNLNYPPCPQLISPLSTSSCLGAEEAEEEEQEVVGVVDHQVERVEEEVEVEQEAKHLGKG